MTDPADLLRRVRDAERAVAELRRATGGDWNLRDAHDVDQRFAARTTNPVLLYDRLTGKWGVGSGALIDPVTGLIHGGFRGNGALPAAVETATGSDRVDIGVFNGTPRLVFEDGASGTVWEQDNSAGVFRWYTPGSLKMSLDSSARLTVFGSVRTPVLEGADGTGPRVLVTGAAGGGTLDLANRDNVNNVVARLIGMAGQGGHVLDVFHDGATLGCYINELGAVGANRGVYVENPVNNNVTFGHLHASGSRTDSHRLWLDVPTGQTVDIARFSKNGAVQSRIDKDGGWVGPVESASLVGKVTGTGTQTTDDAGASLTSNEVARLKLGVVAEAGIPWDGTNRKFTVPAGKGGVFILVGRTMWDNPAGDPVGYSTMHLIKNLPDGTLAGGTLIDDDHPLGNKALGGNVHSIQSGDHTMTFTGSSQSQAISFPRLFTTAFPKVMLTVESAGGFDLIPTVTVRSASGFTYRVATRSGNNHTGTSYLQWVAFEEIDDPTLEMSDLCVQVVRLAAGDTVTPVVLRTLFDASGAADNSTAVTVDLSRSSLSMTRLGG